MKKLVVILSLFTAVVASASAPPEVSEKVLKAFNETFLKATDVEWYETQNSFEASFKQSDIQSKAIYDKNGNLLSSIRYYFEDNLPVHIRSKLKKSYSGKSIYGVTELTVDDQITYHIILQDEKNWYIVISNSYGNLELSRKYKKA